MILPMIRYFGDHVVQCLICLHSSSNIVAATHANYSWSLKSYGLYPSYEALQVPILLGVVASVSTPLPTRTQQLPTLLGQQCWELLRRSVCTQLEADILSTQTKNQHLNRQLLNLSQTLAKFTLLIQLSPLEVRFIRNSHRAWNVRDRLGRQKHKLAASCPPFPSNEAVTITATNFPRGFLRSFQRSRNVRGSSKITWKRSVP